MGKEKRLDCLPIQPLLFSHLASEATQRTLVFSGFCPSAVNNQIFLIQP
ncbi:hypothetical protein [Eisenbergiella tayi]|nr:hypothetical protein [Eisenbergiella tayi]MBS6813549.1 hypothetical protein [Lachnospiraceae bacterium]MDT4534308.1 hypothetical protein [Eisenbergiella tayi]